MHNIRFKMLYSSKLFKYAEKMMKTNNTMYKLGVGFAQHFNTIEADVSIVFQNLKKVKQNAALFSKVASTKCISFQQSSRCMCLNIRTNVRSEMH